MNIEFLNTKETKQLVSRAILVIVFAISVFIGIASIDFGRHWDEPLQLDLLLSAFSKNSWLPSGFYNYPSLTFWLSLGSMLIVSPLSVIAKTGIGDANFYSVTRSVFLILSLSGGFFVYLSVRKFASEFIAASTALIYFTSYQFFYHSRWIAPDAALAAIFAVFIWVFCNAASTGRRRWFLASVVVAGIAASTKWQGAILIIPSFFLVVRLGVEDLRTRLRMVFAGLAIFAGVIVVITPGLLLETGEAIHDIRFELKHYATTHGTIYGVAPNDVSSHYQYVVNMLRYLALDLTSRYWYISLAIFSFSLIGVYCLSRKDKLISFGIAMPAVLLFLLFANQSVFIVRNFLIFLPIILFFAGVAIGAIKNVFARQATVVCLVVFSLIGLFGNFSDARDVGPNWQEVAFRKLNSEIDNHPNREYFLSPGVQLLVSEFDDHGYPNLVECSARTQNIVMLASELSRFNGALRELPALQDGTYKTLGQNEVDFDFYPSWAGNDRILIMNENDQKRFGISCSGLGP